MWQGRGNPDRRPALFGGKGEVRVWGLLEGALAPFDCVLGCELDAGGSVGAHVQDRCAEVIIITEGTGTARVHGEPIALSPGVVVRLPLGKSLALECGPDETLRYLIIKAVV